MSVKDKIAMWNNMANTNPNLPKNNVANLVRTQPVQHVYEPVIEKKSMVETAVIVKPSDLKKKAQLEQGQPQVKVSEYVAKPTIKFTEPVKKDIPNNHSNHITETPSAPKPSEIKKKLQEQISGSSFHLVAPITAKKIEPINIVVEKKQSAKVQYEIERDVPVVSVKQNAEKFGQFYQKRAQEYNKPKEVINPPQRIAQPQVETVETTVKVEVQESKVQLPSKIEQTPTFLLPSHQQKTPEAAPNIPVQQEQVKEQTHNHDMDITLRLKNRNKKKRINFDSDDD